VTISYVDANSAKHTVSFSLLEIAK
jgi:hypothetical protein